ncbi:MAG: manganese efflux pump [Clostridia bacterium]|nr:manganese efflux pump [Clostridia bacterium]
MDFVSLLITASALSMDAFAASVCKGISVSRINLRRALKAGVYFGVFQGIMPLAGFFLSGMIAGLLTAIGHFIAFFLLSLIGLNMISEAYEPAETETDAFSERAMVSMAFATSIDALAVGVTFRAAGNMDIASAAFVIGAVAFGFSAAGVYIGNCFGARLRRGAQIAGGLILVLIGAKMLIQHAYGG